MSDYYYVSGTPEYKLLSIWATIGLMSFETKLALWMLAKKNGLILKSCDGWMANFEKSKQEIKK
jgi:hypothetical protein